MPEKENSLQDAQEDQIEQEQAPAPKGRAAAILAYKSKYADRFPEGSADPEDDEMFDDYMNEHAGMKDKMSKLEEANGMYANREMKLVALIDNNPDLTELLSTLNEDDEFLESVKERKMRFAQKEKNAEETVKNILAWQQEDGITDDERIQRVKWIVKLAEDIDNDVITREIWDSSGKAINHDRNVADAAQAAEIELKNANIDKQRLAMKNESSVFPDVVNGASTPKEKPKKIINDEPRKRDYFDELKIVNKNKLKK